MSRAWPISLLIATLCFCSRPGAGQEPLTGNLNIHDPSTMIKAGGKYYIFYTGLNIASKTSTDRTNWVNGPSVFSNATRPLWVTNAVPGYAGTFWAPDIIYLNGQYYLYYAASTFGSQVSAIGLATNPTLDSSATNYLWTDQGPVIQSDTTVSFNAIDPSVMLADNGTMWMSFGSFWSGIKLIQLDPATGKRITPSSLIYGLATHPPSTAIEGSCLIQHSNYFYLFVNWDTCCAGIDSTYNIRVGRSPSVTGPYLDRNNVNLATGGGSAMAESTGRFIGPGHAGVCVDGDTNWFTYHFYDGNANGTSKLAMSRLYWNADGWPSFTNDWNAFYPFEADGRDDLGLYNGQLRNSATITNEPGRANVLELDGTSGYATIPFPTANANTFAAWVKWNGGSAWQRIFDFGNGTPKYLFLTPMNGNNGRLRFAINSGSGGEKQIDGSAPLPTNAWCHVAVTLDGTSGKLYLNGQLIANSNLTVRPWQVLARTNYIGESQFGADPFFNGEIDSFRIYGRTLSDAEILQLAEAHPSLAHRYSFTANAVDSIGTAHGTLYGNALVTNQSLVLDGTSGGYVNLPGGLVSGASAVSLEFWATFGANGNWARVFDFGKSSGGVGSQFLYYSVHTGTASHNLQLNTTSIVNLDTPGTLDGRTVHVVCIVDPSSNYSATYTNGVLESEMIGAVPPLSGVNSSLSFIGRSLFTADAWLNASIDEFRIYHGRLTPEEIAADYVAGPDALALPMELSFAGSDSGLTLSWPSYGVGFVAETSTNLGTGASWSPAFPAAALSNDVWTVTLPMTDDARFFRLRR
jgi:arabinan endo-1,5-alpha-L-arabinosidase